MKSFVLVFLISIGFLFFTSCGKSGRSEVFSGTELKNLVISSMEGSRENNELIGKLFDFSIPLMKEYNTLVIDSIIVPPAVRYYYVLIEFPNPLYNRFAVYDSSGAMRLMDKSLNGYLKALKYGDQKNTLLTITERFTSKDIIKLERINFYYFSKDTVSLALKTFTAYNDSINDYRQSFMGFSNGRLSAILSSNTKKPLQPAEFSYVLDSVKCRFLTQVTFFDDSLQSMILSKKGNFSKMQMVDKKSALQENEQIVAIDSSHKYNNVQDKKAGFSLSLPPEGWKIQKNVYLSSQLKRPVQGTLYSNEVQGAKISVLEIKDTEVAENYVNYTLDQVVQKFYTVRFTEKIPVARLYFRFFELSCVNKKFLVIFEVPKAAYEKNLEKYQDIINSFSIDC